MVPGLSVTNSGRNQWRNAKPINIQWNTYDSNWYITHIYRNLQFSSSKDIFFKETCLGGFKWHKIYWMHSFGNLSLKSPLININLIVSNVSSLVTQGESPWWLLLPFLPQNLGRWWGHNNYILWVCECNLSSYCTNRRWGHSNYCNWINLHFCTQKQWNAKTLTSCPSHLVKLILHNRSICS